MDYPSKRTTRRKFKMDYLFEFLLKGSLFWRHEFFKLDYHYSHCTGSLHFTRFHFARSSLYTRFIIVPNEFTLCNALHDFLTLYVKWSRENWSGICWHAQQRKQKKKWNPISIFLYIWKWLKSIKNVNTVPAQIERRRSNFRLGFFGEDFTK